MNELNGDGVFNEIDEEWTILKRGSVSIYHLYQAGLALQADLVTRHEGPKDQLKKRIMITLTVSDLNPGFVIPFRKQPFEPKKPGDQRVQIQMQGQFCWGYVNGITA
jgi:hypothetical protein